MALSGDLSDIDLKTVLKLIEDTKGTGKIVFSADRATIALYFKNGKVVNAEGEKDPVSCIEKLVKLQSAKFEFTKMDSVPETQEISKIEQALNQMDSIIDKWKQVYARFPNLNQMVDIGDSRGEEVKMTGEEWKILSLIREPLAINALVANSPFGELKTLLLLASLFDKKLVTIKIQEEDKLLPEDNVIPVKEAGWHALNAPMYGEKNIEFYRRIDGRKDFPTIAKEMQISYKEGREILKYLMAQGKISVRKKVR